MKIYKKRVKGIVEKWCNSCNKSFGLSQFLPDKNGTHGKGVVCKNCRDLASNQKKMEAIKNRLKGYAKSEKMEVEDLIKMYHGQNGSCAICFNEYPIEKISKRNGLVLDHSHIFGKGRGLLCHKCNVGLGFFNDNPELVKSALEYLELYK